MAKPYPNTSYNARRGPYSCLEVKEIGRGSGWNFKASEGFVEAWLSLDGFGRLVKVMYLIAQTNASGKVVGKYGK